MKMSDRFVRWELFSLLNLTDVEKKADRPLRDWISVITHCLLAGAVTNRPPWDGGNHH